MYLSKCGMGIDPFGTLGPNARNDASYVAIPLSSCGAMLGTIIASLLRCDDGDRWGLDEACTALYVVLTCAVLEGNSDSLVCDWVGFGVCVCVLCVWLWL